MEEYRPVGWVNFPVCTPKLSLINKFFQLIDHKSRFVTGTRTLRLWPNGRANPIGTCIDNLVGTQPTIINIEFEKTDRILLVPGQLKPIYNSKTI